MKIAGSFANCACRESWKYSGLVQSSGAGCKQAGIVRHVLWWHLSKVNTKQESLLCRIWRTLSGSLDILSAFAKRVREQIASKTCLLLKVYLGQQPSVFFWCRSQKARAHDSKGQLCPPSVSGWKYSCLKIYLMLLKQFHKGIRNAAFHWIQP